MSCVPHLYVSCVPSVCISLCVFIFSMYSVCTGICLMCQVCTWYVCSMYQVRLCPVYKVCLPNVLSVHCLSTKYRCISCVHPYVYMSCYPGVLSCCDISIFYAFKISIGIMTGQVKVVISYNCFANTSVLILMCSVYRRIICTFVMY